MSSGGGGIFNQDTIHVIAEGLNIGNVQEDAAVALASDLEFQMREILQDSMKFMKHSKQTTLRSNHINESLRLRNHNQSFGHLSSRKQPKFASVSGMGGLFYVQDEVHPLEEIIKQPLPPCPREPCIVAHWLAVEGVQPAIPQNPSKEEAEKILGVASESQDKEKRKRKRLGEVEDVEVKAIVQNVLSEELQLYFETVTSSLQKNKTTSVTLSSVSNDAGLQPLLPYFSQFIFDEVTQNLSKLWYLKLLMGLARSLISNQNMNVEPYLHQLMPPILTCLVGKRLCEDPNEDHWQLRDEAADIVGMICQQFGKNYPQLQSRITKTLLNAFLDPTKPLTSHYGSVVGLSSLGYRVVQLLILPNLRVYVQELLKPFLSSEDINVRQDADRVYHKLVEICGVFLRTFIKETKGSQVPLSLRVLRAQQKKSDVEGKEEEGDGQGEDQEMKDAVEDKEELKSILPEDWLEYYVELKELFGEHISPYLPQDNVSEDPGAKYIF